MIERTLPLAAQVRLALLRWIQEGEAENEQGALPSESEIASRLGVSRATVREALAWLERDRVIYRRQGAGTYVNRAVRDLPVSLDVFLDPPALLERHGHRASVSHVQLSEASLDEELAAALEQAPGSPGVRLIAGYLADEVPGLWLAATVPLGATSDWKQIPREAPVSPTLLAAEITGRMPTHALAIPRAVMPPKEVKRWFGLRAATPVLCLDEVHLTDEGAPVFHSLTYVAPGPLRLRLLRRRDQPPGRLSVW